MHIAPETFQCDEDQSDLTELVLEELAMQIPAAFGPRRTRQFRVVLSCPGGGEPHDVTCSGEITV
jgi:hypothetical protein